MTRVRRGDGSHPGETCPYSFSRHEAGAEKNLLKSVDTTASVPHPNPRPGVPERGSDSIVTLPTSLPRSTVHCCGNLPDLPALQVDLDDLFRRRDQRATAR